MIRIKINILFLLIICLILFSCNTTRNLSNGEYLVRKNIIKTDNKNINTEDIGSYIKQKPNKTILFLFKIHLAAYNLFKSDEKQKGLKKWLYNTVGEPPVILDTILTNKSVKQIKLYLNSKGYFNSIVSKEIVFKKKKAFIKYVINVAEPYHIRNVSYSVNDYNIRADIVADTVNSLIKTCDIYDSDILQNERERVTTNLKNDGYFYFTKEFISYKVDTTIGSHKVDVIMEIRDPVVKYNEYTDSLIKSFHKRYRIRDINIFANFNTLNADTSKYKTYKYTAYQRKKSATQAVYNFLYKDTLSIKPKRVTQSIFFKQGDYFKLKDVEQTYNRLMDLKMFKFVNIQFNESKFDTSDNYLNCNIQLTKTAIQSFSLEAEGTNSSGNLGVAGNIVYQNKNFFHGAEIFNFKIRGAMEIQRILGEKNSETGIKQILPFNTVETGAEANLSIPKFLIPVREERFSKYFKPMTIINAGVNYQRRPDYTRYITNISYGFEWKESQYKKHILYIPELGSVKIYPTEKFDSIINSLNDPKIKNSYKDHLTMALKYSFIYNNQQLNKYRNFNYLRVNFETSGNILRAANNIFNVYHYADGSYTMFNIKYAEYLRIDADYRRYFNLNELNIIVLRLTSGYGLAYWNSTVLPFEKSFFAGGANSLRGWKIYSLGPGSYSDTKELNRTGDVDIEGNFEYRFPISGFFKGALFVDAGNIWLNKKNDKMPGGEFKLNRFYKEFAVSSGFGARFDFGFFIIRLDVAVPFRNPANPEKERWVLSHAKFNSINLNLGIGYPF